MLTATLEEVRRQRDAEQEAVIVLRGEVEMLRGVGCNEGGDGPCGACLKCARRDRDRYSLALKLVAEHCDHCRQYATDTLNGAPARRRSAPTKGIVHRCTVDGEHRHATRDESVDCLLRHTRRVPREPRY
jgi:hypothetical protein